MKVINISDSRRRNSRVGLESRKVSRKYYYADNNKQPVQTIRVVKGSLDTDFSELTKELSPEELSQKLIDSDPEIDFELFGKTVDRTSRVYLTVDNEPAHTVLLKELVYRKDGELKETRELQVQESNINGEVPLQWSGKYHPKEKYFNKFAFIHCYQVSHVDGLTYDFLFNMAKELEEQRAFLFLATGPKLNQPLVMTRNGTPYRAFLEGRTKNDTYMLLLHLTNLELKPVNEQE